MHHLLEDLGITFLIATAVGYIVERIRQPAIVAYLIGGIIIGPEIGPQLIKSVENIEIISEIGLILLLFIVGLEMHPAHLISIMRKVVVPGMGQFLLTVASGILFFTSVGFALAGNNLEALYLALAAGLSSTAIVIKILADKLELDSYAGRLTVGILLFQDFWAILLLAIQPNLSDPGVVPIAIALGKSALLVGATFLVSRFLLGRIFAPISHSPEVVIMLSLSWCVAVAGSAKMMGLSMEMGALVAGVSVSTFPYSFHINAKIMPLRDVFLTLFFISLGMKIPWPDSQYFLPVVLLITFTVISRFVIIIPLSLLSGTNIRTAFIASLNLSQVSEFSLVITGLGVAYGHISKQTLGTVLFAMAITSLVSAYLIKYNHEIYRLIESLLAKINMRQPYQVNAASNTPGSAGRAITILGYHRGAEALLELLALRKPEILSHVSIIDFNVENIRALEARNIAHFYGDVSHADTLAQAGIQQARIIVSTVPDVLLRGTSNEKLVSMCRAMNRDAFIIATADINQKIPNLKHAGANEVLLPYFETAAHLSELLVNLGASEKIVA
jgi:Kef-type K+ transport system membrane component KefB